MPKVKTTYLRDIFFIIITLAPLYAVYIAFTDSFVFGIWCFIIWLVVWVTGASMLHLEFTHKEQSNSEIQIKSSLLDQHIGKEDTATASFPIC